MNDSFISRAIDTLETLGPQAFLDRSNTFIRRRFFRILSGFENIHAKVSPLETPRELVAACMYRLKFKITNCSKITWNSSSKDTPPFRAAAFIISENGESLEQEHAFLPKNFRPGESCDVALTLDIPRTPGQYKLKVDLVRENCYWFAEIGKTLFEAPLTVKPHSTELLSAKIPAIDVTLDITNKCPLKCIQCRKTYFETFDEQQDMNFELFKKISSQVFPYARSVTLSSAGEPLMTRNLFDAIDLTRSYRVKEISFISAGLHLNPGRAEKIVDNGVTRLEFSIDGASAEVYNKIRIGSDFQKVIKNIRYLSDYKKKQKSRTPLLRFNFVLMKSNIHELPDFIDLAATLGGEEVQSQHMVIFIHDLKEEALIFDKARSNHFILEAKVRAARHKIRFYHPPLFTLEDNSPKSTTKVTDGTIWTQESSFDFERKTHPILNDGMQLCTDPWRKLFIDWQGQVFPCCVWKEEPLGDLRKNSFLEIWESDRYRELRKGLTTGHLGKSCAECSVITGGDVNSLQSYFFASN